MSWLAFGLALGVAALTALSYAELGSRFPRSGGESYFCQEAFSSPSLALLVGWLVFCSGFVSMAAVSHAFSGYLLGLRPGAPAWTEYGLLVAFLLLLAGISFWGMRQSSIANIVCTVIEASGLMLVIVVGLTLLARGAVAPAPIPALAEIASPSWLAVAQGGAIAFFAFIGFEDMVNVAEDVKSPRRNPPGGHPHRACRCRFSLHSSGLDRDTGRAGCTAIPEQGPTVGSDSPSRPRDSSLVVHADRPVRRDEHRPAELHHGISAAVRNGRTGPASLLVRRRPPAHPDTALVDRCDLPDSDRPDNLRHPRLSGRHDQRVAAVGIRVGESGPNGHREAKFCRERRISCPARGAPDRFPVKLDPDRVSAPGVAYYGNRDSGDWRAVGLRVENQKFEIRKQLTAQQTHLAQCEAV